MTHVSIVTADTTFAFIRSEGKNKTENKHAHCAARFGAAGDSTKNLCRQLGGLLCKQILAQLCPPRAASRAISQLGRPRAADDGPLMA